MLSPIDLKKACEFGDDVFFVLVPLLPLRFLTCAALCFCAAFTDPEDWSRSDELEDVCKLGPALAISIT